MPGPAAAIPEPEPTNRPAPMTPPIAIIDRWRFFSPACRPEPSEEVPDGVVSGSVVETGGRVVISTSRGSSDEDMRRWACAGMTA
ncbi:hypothetical protein GCM10023083_35660 [Streptomyces phyllanthi]